MSGVIEAMCRRLGQRNREHGYAAILVAILVPGVFLGMAAIGVDTARWYAEVERVQRAADSAALAGVTYMPADLVKARAAALSSATKNGFTNGTLTTITAVEGSKPSQLRVTISTTIDNVFGSYIGVPTATITRNSVADYTAAAPMGSPCNTFGNEPPSQPAIAGQPVAPPGQPAGTALPAAPFPNCTSSPKFWAAIEGPATDKVQGDRYMTSPCASSSTHECALSKNKETRPEGYFWAVHVEPAAVGTSIDVQVYDPAYIVTSVNCAALGNVFPNTNTLASTATNSMNDYTTTDGIARYDDATSDYCSGDFNPGGTSGDPLDTTFTMREQNIESDPMKGAVISGCTQQFKGISSTPTVTKLKKFSSGTTNNASYDPELSRVFHQWVSLCTFTPTRTGDYFVQVRTNVPLGGTAQDNTNANGNNFTSLVYRGNSAAAAATGDLTTGVGLNSFAMRAVPSALGLRDDVAVAGFSRMPILQNAASSTARFNLIRALPQTKGQYIAFDFFDAADGSSSAGSVRVIAPTDATGSIKSSPNIPGCKGALGSASFSSLTNCTVTVKNTTHNGKLQHMIIPLPPDYSCDPATLGGCWFQVEITFSGDVTDFTTWDANIGGDPVRLVE